MRPPWGSRPPLTSERPTARCADPQVLRVEPSASAIFCTLADATARADFDKRFQDLINSIEPWCSECHGNVNVVEAPRRALEEAVKAHGTGSATSLPGDQIGRLVPGVGVGDSEVLTVERVPRREDFARRPNRDAVRLRVSVKGKVRAHPLPQSLPPPPARAPVDDLGPTWSRRRRLRRWMASTPRRWCSRVCQWPRGTTSSPSTARGSTASAPTSSRRRCSLWARCTP